MKSEKGITLISLTIYIIVFAIVLGVVATVSTYFYKNVSSSKDEIEPWTQYAQFNSFFTDEINRENIKVLDCKTEYKNDNEADGIESAYIVFDNGVQYTFIKENEGIYRNQVKICKDIEKCTFEHYIEDGRNKVKVVFKAINGTERNQTYTLKN